MLRTKWFLLIAGWWYTVSLTAKEFDLADYKIEVNKISDEIIIDGHMDEPAWQQATVIQKFYQHYPADSIESLAHTEVMIMYNDKYLYIAAKCLEPNADYIIQSLKRDDLANFWMSDGFCLTLDPFNKDKNGYFFGVNALGAKVDGTLSQSRMEPSLDGNWNTRWYAATTTTDEGYFYEIAIPFSSIKYNADIHKWGINFVRCDMKRSVYDIWTCFSRNYDGLHFGYNGEMEFTGNIPESQGNKAELTPSLSGKLIRDFENNEAAEYKIQGGIEAKLALNSKLNLDMSILPDFSTVEVDQQYIDFNKYEWYMPEQRQFFLENNDLFSSFGSYEDYRTPPYAYKIKPIYTRRIGIVDWELMPMIFGARFSGNLTRDLRVGLLDVQIDKENDIEAQNYSALTFQQSVLKSSSIKGMLVNRQSIDGFNINAGDYNRNAGLEFDYLTNDGKWSVLAKYHQSFNPEKYDHSAYYGGGFAFTSKKIRIQNWYNHVGENYIADVGYVPRLYHRNDFLDTTIRIGYTEISGLVDYTLPASNVKINQQLPYFRAALIFHPDGSLNEIQQEAGYYMEFDTRSNVYAGIIYNYTELLYPFDILDNDHPVAAGKYHNYNYIALWNTSPLTKIQLTVNANYGNFYSGKKLFTETRIKYRVQPWGSFSISYARCRLEFNDEYGNDTYHLSGLRTEIAFSKDLYWTTLVQHNTQKDNINFNSLLQWRFKPMSDFYVVVKDDISIDGFDQKKFQIIFKLSYWLKV